MEALLVGLIILASIVAFIYFNEQSKKKMSREEPYGSSADYAKEAVPSKAVSGTVELLGQESGSVESKDSPTISDNSNGAKGTLEMEPATERKYSAVWDEISRVTNNSSKHLKRLCYGKFEFLERSFRDIYHIDEKKNVCHSGGYTNPDFPLFVIGFTMARNEYASDVKTRTANAYKRLDKSMLNAYAKAIVKLLTQDANSNIKDKIQSDEVRKIMDDYKGIPLMADCFEINEKHSNNIPPGFKSFIIGYYMGTYRFKKVLLSDMIQSWDKNYKPQKKPAIEHCTINETKGTQKIEYSVSKKPQQKTMDSYASIAKQMVNNADPYRAIWDRMRNDIGISDSRFKQRVTKNTAHLENMYRKQRHIEPYKDLYNGSGFVDNDFFAFMLGYILADHLFNDDDKMTAHASESGSYDYESEVEYEDADLWNDGNDEILPEEISDEYDGDDFDTDDYDSEDYHLDEDFAGVDRDATFQDDYGFNGDDMYSFDGEFIE